MNLNQDQKKAIIELHSLEFEVRQIKAIIGRLKTEIEKLDDIISDKSDIIATSSVTLAQSLDDGEYSLNGIHFKVKSNPAGSWIDFL